MSTRNNGIVDMADIARMFGVTKSAVWTWRTRAGTFPAPDYEWSIGPAWDTDTVVAWAEAHHRVAPDGRLTKGPYGRPRKSE